MQENTLTFQTKRLSIFNWKNWPNDLIKSISLITTTKVMASLPSNWRNLSNRQTISQWINHREKEGQCLCIVNQTDQTLIGILFIYTDNNIKEMRLGYLIGEQYWQKGFASETIKGLCEYCKIHFQGYTLIGGVASSNSASIKVLQKNGFYPQEATSNDTLFLERTF